jgi:hypothetical protein
MRTRAMAPTPLIRAGKPPVNLWFAALRNLPAGSVSRHEQGAMQILFLTQKWLFNACK